MTCISPNNRQGFTLVEMSIVLGIIGLVVGGIIAGSSFIRSSELQSLMKDMQRYGMAAITFKDRYGYLPGDYPDAFKVWGTNCGPDAPTSSDGCNGDGNGVIEETSSTREQFRAWQHLSLAGLIQGNFTGMGSGGNWEKAVIDENIPGSEIIGVGFGFSSYLSTLPNMPGSRVYFGREINNRGPWQGAITPAEAYSIDAKMDDGKADRGKFITVPGRSYRTALHCVTPMYNLGVAFDYMMDDPEESCHSNYFFTP